MNAKIDLAAIELFSDLAQAELDLISRHSVSKTYPKNTILITEGDRSDTLYIILEGTVRVYVSDAEGREVTLSIQSAGEYFGELALLDEEPRSASVIAQEKCRMTVISKADFQRCLRENPEIAIKLLRSLAQRIRSLTTSVKSLALEDVHERVAHTLSKLAIQKNQERVIKQRLTHQDIANMVGASREMVSRIMKELTLGGYIRVQDKQITLHGELPLKM